MTPTVVSPLSAHSLERKCLSFISDRALYSDSDMADITAVGAVIHTSANNFVVCNWASEASPILGCSIEITCYICVGLYVLVCQSAKVELRGPKMRMLSFGRLKMT